MCPCRQQAQGIQFMRYGKDDMKISGGQELVLLLNDPHLLVQTLALWGMPVTTRIVTDPEVTALIASIDMAAQSGCTTSANGRKCSPMMRRESAGW